MQEKKEFVSLLSVNYHRIKSFIFCMVPSWVDSEDIMQETTVLMWEKFDQYKQGTNFVAWALTIAKFKILSYQRDKTRNRIQLDNRVLEMIEEVSREKQSQNSTSEKVEVLNKCIDKLPKKEKQIIRMKYSDSFTNENLAHKVGVSVPTIYRYLSIIHMTLLNCVNRTLSSEDF